MRDEFTFNGLNCVVVDVDENNKFNLMTEEALECKEEVLVRGIPIPEFKADMCKQVMKVRIPFDGTKEIIYHTPCVKTRKCSYNLKFKYCFPSEDAITSEAKNALVKCLATSIGAAIIAVSSVPDPTATIAVNAFMSCFYSHRQTGLKSNKLTIEREMKVSM